MTTDTLAPGDTLRIERRYVLEGQLTSSYDEGRFEGIERVGSSEHIVIKDVKSKEVRLIPLHAIAEIKLVKAKRRSGQPRSAQPAEPAAWDPSVA